MNTHEQDFAQIIQESGIPLDEQQARQQWEAIAARENIQINNNSVVSPFWRIISALITAPFLFLLRNVLLTSVIPNAYIKTASGTPLEILAWALDVERKDATKAIWSISCTRSNASGTLNIDAGTRIDSTPFNGEIYSLITQEDHSFKDGENRLFLRCEAVHTGSAYNLPPGYFTVLPQAIPGIESVTNERDSLTTPGTDVETDEQLRLRCRRQFLSLNQYHNDAVYRRIITTFDGVNDDNVFFDSDAPRGPGTANAYILPDVGRVSDELLQRIEQYIMDEGHHGHGDDVRLFAMPETLHDIHVEISLNVNVTPHQSDIIGSQIDTFIRCAFRENTQYTATPTMPFQRFSFSRLTQELHREFTALHLIHFNVNEIENTLSICRLNTLSVTKR